MGAGAARRSRCYVGRMPPVSRRECLAPQGRDNRALTRYTDRKRSVPADVLRGLSAGFFVFWDWIGAGRQGTQVTFTWPALTIGTVIATVVLIATCLLLLMRMIDVPAALLIAAVCAMKL